MNFHARMVISVLSIWAMTGCTEPRITALEKQNSTLKTETESLKKEVATLKEELDAVKSQQAMNDLNQEFATLAYLTPGDEGNSVVQTDLGKMTVQLSNVEPYANGSRITLRVGNLTRATENGAKA